MFSIYTAKNANTLPYMLISVLAYVQVLAWHISFHTSEPADILEDCWVCFKDTHTSFEGVPCRLTFAVIKYMEKQIQKSILNLMIIFFPLF